MSGTPRNNSRETSGSTPPMVPTPIYHICRILLGAIFILASLEKIIDPWSFGRSIQDYEILTGSLAYLISPIAAILPLIELVTGFFLIINRWVRPSALIILGLNVLFIVAILSAMVRGLEIDCGCGLEIEFLIMITGNQADEGALIRDFIFLTLNLVVLFAPQSSGK